MSIKCYELFCTLFVFIKQDLSPLSICKTTLNYFFFAFLADVTYTANMVPAPSSPSPCPLPSSLGPHPPQASRSEAHQTLLHLCPEAQTGEVQALCRLLQEGVRQLPLLPRHEEVWWTWTYEEELYHETVSSGESSSALGIANFVVVVVLLLLLFLLPGNLPSCA